jgi:hypothetical protein
MPVTQADIDTLNQAIADGVRQVTLPGGQVTIFQTTESLIKARDDMRTELQRAQARTLLHYAGRGYQG